MVPLVCIDGKICARQLDLIAVSAVLFLCVSECVCMQVSVPASQLSNAFFSVSSRCALSYQACQTLTFRRCLLLDSIAKVPEPEGERHFPSLSTSISVSLSVSHPTVTFSVSHHPSLPRETSLPETRVIVEICLFSG